MRVVFDSNVLVRAAHRGGFAAKLLSYVVNGPHVLVLSPFILSELARVLRYPRMLSMHDLDDAMIDDYVRYLQSAALLVYPDPSDIVAVAQKDPDDDQVIATAVLGNAEAICTLDAHFDEHVREYCGKRGIRIMTDLEFLDLIDTSRG